MPVVEGPSPGHAFKDNTTRQPRTISPKPASLGQPGGTKRTIEAPPTTIIIVKADNFTFSEMHFFFSQSIITGPNTRLASNQACILGEDLAKQAAATKTNGVVGNNGSTTPTPPIKRNITPKTDQGFNVRHRSVQDASKVREREARGGCPSRQCRGRPLRTTPG